MLQTDVEDTDFSKNDWICSLLSKPLLPIQSYFPTKFAYLIFLDTPAVNPENGEAMCL
jgi:hypothetical protein